MNRHTLALLFVGVAGAAGYICYGRWNASAEQDHLLKKKEPVSVEASAGSTEPPRVQEYIVRYQPAASTEPVAQVEAPAVPPPPDPQEITFEIEQKYLAIPLDASRQARTERGLHVILTRLAGGNELPMQNLSCRGDTCRAELNFDTGVAAQTILNKLPYDQDWIDQGFGFNALPTNPDDPNCSSFIVYFTSRGTS